LDDEAVSIITDEHRANIGVKSEPMPVAIKDVDFRLVRDALEDDDPRYADDTGNAAPYAMSILEPEPGMGRKRGFVPQVLPQGILTQTEWTVHRPLKLAERLYARDEILDIRERLGGRFGRSVLVLLRTEYRDESGELVAETGHTITQFDPAGGREKA
jgi:hypothetical protein